MTIPPDFVVGGLVRWKGQAGMEADDWNAIGIILELRSMPLRQPDARILWSDLPEARRHFISDLIPVALNEEETS